MRFSRRFGPLAIHVLEDQLLAGHPEILLVSNKTRDKRYTRHMHRTTVEGDRPK